MLPSRSRLVSPPVWVDSREPRELTAAESDRIELETAGRVVTDSPSSSCGADDLSSPVTQSAVYGRSVWTSVSGYWWRERQPMRSIARLLLAFFLCASRRQRPRPPICCSPSTRAITRSQSSMRRRSRCSARLPPVPIRTKWSPLPTGSWRTSRTTTPATASPTAFPWSTSWP